MREWQNDQGKRMEKHEARIRKYPYYGAVCTLGFLALLGAESLGIGYPFRLGSFGILLAMIGGFLIIYSIAYFNGKAAGMAGINSRR